MNATTVNGQPVQILARFTASEDGADHIEVIKVRGAHTEWPIGTDVTVSFLRSALRGRVTAVIENETHTELRIHYRSKSSSRPSA